MIRGALSSFCPLAYGDSSRIKEFRLGKDVQATSGCQRVTEQGKYGALEKYGNDLTELARRGKLDPILGRDDEIQLCMQILSQETKNNPILIGGPDEDRTEVVEGLAQRMVCGDVSETLVHRKLISLAGAKSREDFEGRLKAVLTEIIASNAQIILFVDDIHTLVGAGKYEETDVGNLMKSMIRRGELRLVGATTLSKYRKYIELLDLEHRFQKVFCGNEAIIGLISLLIKL